MREMRDEPDATTPRRIRGQKAINEETIQEARQIWRAFDEKRKGLVKDDKAGLAFLAYAEHQLCALDEQLRELGVDVSAGAARARQIPMPVARHPRTRIQAAKMEQDIARALWRYQQWEVLAKVGVSTFYKAVGERALAKVVAVYRQQPLLGPHGPEPEAAAFEAMFRAWEVLLLHQAAAFAKAAGSAEQELVGSGVMAGFARAHLALKPEGRLYRTLSEEGSPPAVLEQGLPAAARISWDERAAGEPLKPNPAKPGTNFVSRVAREMVGAGSEAARKPENVAPQSVEALELGTDKDALGLGEREAREYAARQVLDGLEHAAALADREKEVLGRIRWGMEAAEIAAELKTSKNNVYVTKHNAIKKLREAAKAAGF